MTATIYLPFPPSNNELYRNPIGGGKRPKTRRYMTWTRAADAIYLAQKRYVTPIHGPYRLAITLDCSRRVTTYGKRRTIDCGNFEKAVQDFLKRVDLIDDDSLCEEVSIGWGWPEEEGCRVTILPTNVVALPQEARAA